MPSCCQLRMMPMYSPADYVYNADFECFRSASEVLQKSSKHFLISIFFPHGEGGHPLPVHPRSVLWVSKNEYLFFTIL